MCKGRVLSDVEEGRIEELKEKTTKPNVRSFQKNGSEKDQIQERSGKRNEGPIENAGGITSDCPSTRLRGPFQTLALHLRLGAGGLETHCPGAEEKKSFFKQPCSKMPSF